MSTESTNTANEPKQTSGGAKSRLNADAAVFQPSGLPTFAFAAPLNPSEAKSSSQKTQAGRRGHSHQETVVKGRGNSKRKAKPTKLTVATMIPNSSELVMRTTKAHGPNLRNKKKGDGPVLNLADFPALPSARKVLPVLQDQSRNERDLPEPVETPAAKVSAKDSNPTQLFPAKILKRGEPVPPKPSKLKAKQLPKAVDTEETKQSATQTVDTNHTRLATGSEHDLMRLVQERKMTLQNKGRQRLRPRKKKFSTLKKKVLEERLRKWRELNPEETGKDSQHMPGAASDIAPMKTVCVQNFADIEAVNDDDEYEELVQNIQELAEKIGSTRRLFISRDSEFEEAPAFVEFVDSNHAQAAVNCWDGLVIGGQELKCFALKGNCDDSEDSSAWQPWCLMRFRAKPDESSEPSPDMQDSVIDIAVVNALNEDDFEDPDCLEESINDIKERAQEFGEIVGVQVEAETAKLIISYRCNALMAEVIVSKLSKVMLGGTLLDAAIHGTSSLDSHEEFTTIILLDVLTNEDFDDEDCLEESLCDIRELAARFGAVKSVEIDSREESRNVLIHYSASTDVAMHAIDEFNRINIGGGPVAATLFADETKKDFAQVDSGKVEPGQENFEPMYSGDKLIPERFAICKRVPKVRTNEGPRHYAVASSDERAKPLLTEMLAELMRLQRRAMEEKNTKAKRRIVMGLREVARGIRSRKVKMVVMASNLDEYDIIDEKLNEIVNLAVQAEIPMFFEFTKKGLGKAVGKTIKIAAVGIQNADGAHQHFKKLVSIAAEIQHVLSTSIKGTSNVEGLRTD